MMLTKSNLFLASLVIFGVFSRVHSNVLIPSEQNHLTLEQGPNNDVQKKMNEMFDVIFNMIDLQNKNQGLDKINTEKRAYRNSNRRHHLSRWDIGFGKRDAPSSFFESLFDGKLSKKYDRGQQIWDVAYGK